MYSVKIENCGNPGKMLQPLTLKDKPLFDLYARQTQGTLSTYAFAPLYVWRKLFQFYWTIIDDRFCVFANQDGDYFMPIIPMGKATSDKAIYKSYAFMLEANRATHITRIENVPESLVPFFRELGFRVTFKETEYLYKSGSLIELRGNSYKSKRAAYNAFTRNHPNVTLSPYQPQDFSDCLALYELWQKERRTKSRDPFYQAMLEDSRHAHHTGLRNAAHLGLEGSVVHIGGKLNGYIFGYPLNARVFSIIFEIANLRFKGLPQFLFRQFCQEKAAYPFINAMDDSGLENLRRVKLSYHPTEQVQSYNAVLPLNHEMGTLV